MTLFTLNEVLSRVRSDRPDSQTGEPQT